MSAPSKKSPSLPCASSPPEPVFRRLRRGGGALPLLWFILTRRLVHWVTMLLLALFLIWFGNRHPEALEELKPPGASRPPAPQGVSDWLQRWQAYLGAATLTMALLVWFGEVHEDWVESRPKLMTSLFMFQGKPAIVCRHVALASPSDLRAWAQQVCAQTAKQRFLDFYPRFHVCRPCLGRLRPRAWDRKTGRGKRVLAWIKGEDVYQHFVIQFHLREWADSNQCWYLNAADPRSTARRLASEAVCELLKTLPEWPELTRAARWTSSAPSAAGAGASEKDREETLT